MPKLLSKETINLRNPEDITQILSGDPRIQIDQYGYIVISISEGLLRKEHKKFIVTYWFISNNNIVFAYNDNNIPKTFGKLVIEKNGVYWECIDSNLEKLCNIISNTIKNNLSKLKIRETPSKKVSEIKGFRLSNTYQNILDGLAEVTIATTQLKYPLIERRIYSLEYIGYDEGIIEYLYNRFKQGKYMVILQAYSWIFSMIVDLDTKEYTPSFIDIMNNIRLLGSEAIKKLRSIDPQTEVSFSVYMLQV